jgi:hypothetical protein
MTISRRNILGSAATLSLVTVTAANAQNDVPQPERSGRIPPELVQGHLEVDAQTIAKLRKQKMPVLPA